MSVSSANERLAAHLPLGEFFTALICVSRMQRRAAPRTRRLQRSKVPGALTVLVAINLERWVRAAEDKFQLWLYKFYSDLHNKGRFILLPSDGFSHIHTTQQFTSLAVAFSLNLGRQWNIFARHIISTSERAPESVCRPDFLRATCEYCCTRQRALSVA